MIEQGLQNGELDAGDLEGILDEPFMGRDGKMTNLEKLKPHFYKRLYTLKEKYRKDEAVSEEKQFRAAVVAAREKVMEIEAAAAIATEDSLIHPIIVFNFKDFAVSIILNASVIPPHFINFMFTYYFL